MPSPLSLRGRNNKLITHDEPLSPLQMLLLNLFHVAGTYQLIIKNEDRLSYVGVHYCL